MTTDLLGEKLGQYRLKKLAGEGGLATVYKAHQENLDRWVAIKVLHSDDGNVLARFEREARAVAQLRHRNILMVYEYGKAEGLPYIAMEYVEGGSLEDYLVGKPMEWIRVVSISMGIAEALHFAHQHGIIHRDVKPSNILMPQDDWPLLADFGLVKVSEDADRALTATGTIMGTPAYIAPEQARGEKIGPHADMYSLGVIMFEMITGRLPFEYENANYLMLAHIQETPPSPRSINPLCPQDLEEIILKTIEKSPEDRFADLQEMINALRKTIGSSTLDISSSSTLEVTGQTVRSQNLPLRPATGPSSGKRPVSTARLLIPEKNQTIPLPEPDKNGLILGRTHGKNKVDIDLNPHGAMESGISRRHSRLLKSGDDWLIDDLGSMNGTDVNSTKLTPGMPVRLKNGDVIHCGRLYLIFLNSPS
ncbi:MAG: FHA domain-containing serine/threonine-protein kinase [Anaerolineae bacterium]|nr:FHA domain-containing serine/threonine-protein kinase [Anaerolineae bacterium]